MHAMSPGHGKTIVGAYLVGSRGTAKHALFLGSTVTITHTIGVFALGFVTLFLSQYILPERLYPFLEMISGLLVIAIGVSLFGSRLRGAFRGRTGQQSNHEECAHEDGRVEQTKREQRDHLAHSNVATVAAGSAGGRRTSLAVLDHPGHTHDGLTGLTHSHGGREHSHLPPGANGKPIGWRSLLALGISGGLLPCPSALVVMLSAISLHRVAFGLLLILAFSIGLAGVLSGIGLLLVYAGKIFNRIPTHGRLIRLVPVASAAVIVLAGIAITAAALPQTRLM
jgi:ABC-type nickel/cobalt efflux system permease component RcnA